VRVADNASTNANATSPAFPVALLHGNHEVRLGGPSLAEALPGTLLRAVAQHGNRLRVMLAPGAEAWINERAIEAVAPGTRLPIPVFTSFSVDAAAEAATTSEADVVNLPLGATPLPYAARPRPLPDGRQGLELMLWGTHYAQTWISHRAGRRWVDDVTAEPAGPDRLRLQITLKPGQRLWGWRIEKSPAGLRVLLRAAPRLATAPDSPLKGLRVAVEAGHGSADNLGAVGATGVPEKDINRWTADALQAELQAAGAQVVVIREGDENPPLRERARRVAESQAHLFVSVHANSTDTGAGFLRVSGTSHFYKHAPHHALGAAVHQRVLAATGLPDFGLVGNFNYTPVRLSTWAPAVLVEQAFVSHPGDEAMLLDPAFRARLAQAVRQGLEDFLKAR
jgi:N-acetylmuramoyl-L-alanine amidase